MSTKMYRVAGKLLGAVLIISVCDIGQSLAASGRFGFDPSMNDARWAHRISFCMQLNEPDFSNVERAILYFQKDTHLGVVVRPLYVAYGIQHYGNVLEAEFKISDNKLPTFMMDDYYSITIEELCLSLWYRRSVPIAIGSAEVCFLPGAGIGCSSTTTFIGPDRDLTKLMYASCLTYAVGMQSTVKILGGRDQSSWASLSLVVDYRYRFDDPPVKHINGGEIFFPDVKNFNFSGHAISVGVQVCLH